MTTYIKRVQEFEAGQFHINEMQTGEVAGVVQGYKTMRIEKHEHDAKPVLHIELNDGTELLVRPAQYVVRKEDGSFEVWEEREFGNVYQPLATGGWELPEVKAAVNKAKDQDASTQKLRDQLIRSQVFGNNHIASKEDRERHERNQKLAVEKYPELYHDAKKAASQSANNAFYSFVANKVDIHTQLDLFNAWMAE